VGAASSRILRHSELRTSGVVRDHDERGCALRRARCRAGCGAVYRSGCRLHPTHTSCTSSARVTRAAERCDNSRRQARAPLPNSRKKARRAKAFPSTGTSPAARSLRSLTRVNLSGPRAMQRALRRSARSSRSRSMPCRTGGHARVNRLLHRFRHTTALYTNHLARRPFTRCPHAGRFGAKVHGVVDVESETMHSSIVAEHSGARRCSPSPG
jgi:hypothetical protein